MSNLSNDIAEGFKMTELGPLPEEWKVVSIGNLASVVSGGSAPQGDHCFRGSNPFIRVRHIEQGADRITDWNLITDQAVHDRGLRLFPKGTIVFPKSGASIYLEKRAVLPVDAYIVSHLCALLPKFEIVDGSFLFHALRHIRLAELKADGYPTLNLSEIKVRTLPFPPLPEQQTIARVLSTIQKAIEAQDKIIAATKELKKSLMKHLFIYGPVPVSEAERVPLKETEIGPVPEHWGVKQLLDTATLQRGKDLPKQNQIPGQYPIVGSSGVIGYHNESVCSGPGVVTGRSGSIGNLAYVEENYWPHNTGLYVKDFHGNNPKFIYYLLHSVDFRKYSTGVSVPTLNRNFVHSALVPVPPTQEQQQIAYMLTSVDKKIEAEEGRKAALQSLFRTMLHNLMTGKVRVKDLEVAAV